MIKRAIEERLATKPEVYGKPLLRTLKGYWKLRVGEYRVVFKISGNDLRIFGIIHPIVVLCQFPPARHHARHRARSCLAWQAGASKARRAG